MHTYSFTSEEADEPARNGISLSPKNVPDAVADKGADVTFPDDGEFDDAIAEIAGTPLDRSKPLWEMYFVEGLLAQLDRRQFEVFAYYLYPRDDHITERVQRHADHFVRLAGFSYLEQTQRIRDDGIDILIDLAGHTGGNALLTLAHKAAPVQVSWLGYPATTGLQAVDYKFTDEVTDPPDADAQYSERLYRLPTLFACYRPMSRQPLWRYQPRYLVRPAPALSNGFSSKSSVAGS